MKYSSTGPPSSIPEVASIIPGESALMASPRESPCSMLVKYSESNGLSSVSSIFLRSSWARYSGYASWMAEASDIMPSVNTGASTILPAFM